VRALIDYRPALRERSGVGEYTHQLVRALAAGTNPAGSDPVDVTVFSSSSKDRLRPDADLAGVRLVDRHIPVRLLNLAWHRMGWPPVEALAGDGFDVVHSLHPLLMPARRAAQVVTIHDLNFLLHPERTRAEIRRDYPVLARAHAHRADRVIVVPAERISVCAPGRPDWAPRPYAPVDGYVLFFGTLEPRKNLGTLLDAYEMLVARGRAVPELRVAGKATEQSTAWLERMGRPPLNRVVRHIGYVAPESRRGLYEGARLLVQPSFEEGFGLPVLEAMTVGVPVVAANAGALPEVGGDAVHLVDPTDAPAMADAIERLLHDPTAAESAVARGFVRAATFSWARTAQRTRDAYVQAIAHQRQTRGAA
jgi:glycosyltransferase involved in cell wall biosynthesis